jgi:hypothetical protein
MLTAPGLNERMDWPRYPSLWRFPRARGAGRDRPAPSTLSLGADFRGGEVWSAAPGAAMDSCYGVIDNRSKNLQHCQWGRLTRLAPLAQRCGSERSTEYCRVNCFKWLPVKAILVPEHTRPSGGLRLQKLFSRR